MNIIQKQDKFIRLMVLVLSTIIIIMSFIFIFLGNKIGILLNVIGIIGLGYSYILRKKYEMDWKGK